jgi:hypothetical protein
MNINSFVLDFSLLEEQNLSVEEFIALISLVNGVEYPNQYLSLQSKQFVKITEDNEIILREKGKLFVELVSIDKVSSSGKKKISKPVVVDGFDEFIFEYRLQWKGRKAGSMGSLSSCKEKMIRWMEENPTYTKEEILKAAKLYLNTLENIRYLQRADFFIFKKDENKEESSRLSAFIEEIDERPVEDWTNILL